MRSLQDEIAEMQRELSCPVCNRTFSLRDIQLKAFNDEHNVELSVICNRGHFPVILLVPVNLKEVAKAGLITKTELQRTVKALDSFEGSFENILK
ncbi:MAG: hypothetical protein HZB70_01375 [Candidatus Berkelbacteria bacterium]|nr:MAG: hypothetical protein HZB70_01375 [Candidatus Berkelbacteria bacterium]QQG52012.1 MAG: hypothetical protein HY845_01620 [Candidatus Berkelbacteria bacterium]